MEQYAEKVQAVLEKLVDKENQQSRNWITAVNKGEDFNLKPFFSRATLYGRMTLKIQERLADCGWGEEVEAECQKIIRKKGLDNITMDDLVNEVIPHARGLVPLELKRDLVALLKDALMKEMEEPTYKV